MIKKQLRFFISNIWTFKAIFIHFKAITLKYFSILCLGTKTKVAIHISICILRHNIQNVMLFRSLVLWKSFIKVCMKLCKQNWQNFAITSCQTQKTYFSGTQEETFLGRLLFHHTMEVNGEWSCQSNIVTLSLACDFETLE